MQEIQMVVPYRQNIGKSIIFYLLCILSFGLVYVVATWHYKIWAILRMSKCEIFAAEYFRIDSKDGTQVIVPSHHYMQKGLDYIGFNYRYQRFIYRQGRFEKIVFQLQDNKGAHQRDHLRSVEQLKDYQDLYGINSTEIPRKPILSILIDELMHPLFVVQLLQIFLWIYEEYTSYAIILLLTSIISMVDTLFEYRESYREIRLNSKLEHEVKIIRFGQKITIHSRELVPGDIILIEPFQVIACDCVLIEGTCIVQEQFLNGEQTPITKSNLPDDDQAFVQKDGNMLYMSTFCLRADENCLAFVVSTGFNTKKGELIREVMLTPDYSFDFYDDSMRYLKYLSIVAIVGYLIALPFKIYFLITYPFIEATDLITDILDLLAVCVPPTLPTTLQIGLSLALKRFKKKKIYCFNPNKINLAGVVSQVCFDKTGTLTEDEQRLYGVIEMNNQGQLNPLLKDFDNLNKIIRLVMACCNNIVNEEEIIYGDHLDLALFKNSSAKIFYRTVLLDGINYDIVKTFEFTQELQRICCIIHNQQNHNKYSLVKGSPEKVKQICENIPEDYTSVFKYYSHHGFKVIACAYKQLLQEDVIPTREYSESKLTFLCFLVLENRVKDNAEQVIQQLKSAKIDIILVTGDNVLTSMRVARQTRVVEENEQLVYGELAENNNELQIDWKDMEQQFKEIENQMHNDTRTLCAEILQQKLPNSISKFNFDAKSCENLDNNIAIVNDEAQEQLQRSATLAITGKLFTYLMDQAKNNKDYKYIDQLITKTKVYAKMRREHKAELINYLKTKKQIVFCGDGGADIQAMRTADVGISLTNTKLSLAAPFTSGQEDLSTVPIILIEGRGALTTSFQAFEYMTMCSLVQFLSCTILYFQYSYMTNSQFLILDLFVVLPLSILMTYTNNLTKLTTEIPQRSLVSVEVLSIILGQCFIQMTFQMLIYLILIYQDWYKDPVTLSHEEYGEAGFMQSFEATSLFLVTNFQYIMLSVSLSYDPRFKKPFYSNRPFTFYLILLVILELYLLMFTYRDDTEDDYLNLTFKVKGYEMPQSWLMFLLGMIILNSTLTHTYQIYGVPYVIIKMKNKL
ncbi:unnamed protein product [Paramecium octaurelia]|uniref:Cation-transporting ATPase n=1 Tax=Paramecium octaurelia TaxID=43137 RepID=A0A8S1UQU6_PAROT|nr:unnamed protein product [Paramecium octaurelia]